ncbi:YidC/Oxa1 family membrane protein insertase [Leifsonia sp. AG29]|uniref:YidC/Oxa1 family membrane protein insertase n=1 Tax=Leifsonia sp. AG29 TaxID=2598860 RepID=UPI00131B7E7C|nr:YidC/Oxa1 family membrane protein insertase [Leifsonia sp. AG29]
MDFFSWPPVAAVLDAAYRLVIALSDAFAGFAGPASGIVAVIVLTMLVRLILLPVGVSQVRAELTRRRLAPRLAELQRRHAGDREALARATVELYRTEEASPFAGMLPLIAQIPVLATVYALFSRATIAGHVNSLLGEHAWGAPLGTSFVGLTGVGPGIWQALPVSVVVLALIALVTAVSRRVLAVPVPDGSATPNTGVVRALSFLPYATVVFAAFVPLAAAVYILTSTTWTVLERYLLRRLLDPARPGGADGTARPSISR